MGAYSNCLLQGYGVLPSAPTKVHVTNIETNFAIIHWSTPKTLADTVSSYNVAFRILATYDTEYTIIPKATYPFILSGLNHGSDYEFYVEAVNIHGVGEPSSRIAFRTESKVN